MLTKPSTSNLNKAQMIAAYGMHAQAVMVRVVSENLANSNSTAPSPDKDPYRRKTVSFSSMLEPKTHTEVITVSKIGKDPSKFVKVHRPGDPGADKDGFVQKTNVNTSIEMMDLRQASITNAACREAYSASTAMLSKTVDALRGDH